MRLKIENDGLGGHQAQVWIDGVYRQDVARIELLVDAQEITRAYVTFLVDGVDIDVEADGIAQ